MLNKVDIIQEQLKHISFSDAEVLSAVLEGQEAHIVIKDWRERKVHLNFTDVVLFKSFGFGGDIHDCHILIESKEIREAIQVIEEDHGTVPEEHGFVHLSFSADAPILVVVFEALKVEIES